MSKYLLMVLLLASFTTSAQQQTEADKQEDKAYDALTAVPEVKKMIDNDTDKVWALMMRTVQRPTERFKYYWIEVGHQDKSRFIAQFHFYIKPPAMEVFYKDPKTDSLYTPTEWRVKGK